VEVDAAVRAVAVRPAEDWVAVAAAAVRLAEDWVAVAAAAVRPAEDSEEALLAADVAVQLAVVG
jgi:hypothetical protein